MNVLGMIFLVVGIINRFIPGLPTTPFLILASMLFAKANPKMQAWLLRNKSLGPYLDNYYNKKGMATAYKIRTCAFMWGGKIFVISFLNLLWLQIGLVFVGIAVTVHIFIARTRKPEEGQYGFKYNLFTILLMWIWFTLALVLSAETIVGYAVLSGLGIGLSVGILIFAFVSNKKLHNKGE